MKEPKFVYIRDERNNPVGCIAYRLHRDTSVDSDVIEYGYSIKHPKDYCNKKLARNIAQQRLEICTAAIAIRSDDVPFEIIIRLICKDLIERFFHRRHFVKVLVNTITDMVDRTVMKEKLNNV